jgi:hypothetical protein
VKAYIRKSHVLVGMRENTKALDACQAAAEADSEGKHTTEIQQQMYKINQAMAEQRAGETDEQAFARAMKDPEVAEIMADPIMRSILEQAQSDPGSIQEHMKNPGIRAKIVSRRCPLRLRAQMLTAYADEAYQCGHPPHTLNIWVESRSIHLSSHLYSAMHHRSLPSQITRRSTTS